MAQQELDLFKFASVCVTEPRTGSAKIMWSKTFKANPLRAFANHAPDNILRDTAAPDLAVLANRTKDLSFGQPCC
jgi:hypothetical protein